MSIISYIYVIFDMYIIFIFLYIYYINSKKIPIYNKSFKSNRKNNITFSIIVPTYNEPINVISSLLDNLRKLKYPNDLFEVIIVDDSERDILKLVNDIVNKYKKYINVKLIHRNKPKGFKPGALNTALKYSKGEYLVILDADTRLPPDYLSVASNIIQHNKCHYIQSKSIPSIKGSASYAYASFIEFRNEILLEPSSNTGFPFLTGYGYVISKAIVEKVKGWREDVLTEDLDLYLRLASAGFNGVLHPLNILESPPASFKDLRIQQERWIIGSFQVIKKVLKDFIFKRSFPPRHVIFTSFYIPLLINDIAILTSFILPFTNNNINFELFSLINIIIYIILIPASAKLLRNMVKRYGVKHTLFGLGLSSLLYNYLSVKSLYFIGKVLLNKNIKWRVTGKELSKGSIDLFSRILLAPIYIVALYLCIQSNTLFLFFWILTLALSYIVELLLEIYK